MAIEYFKHVRPEAFNDYLSSYVGNFFIRQPEAPLKQYYARHYGYNTELGNIITWAQASKVFNSFGEPILKRHPIAYFRYFVYLNAWQYFIPPLSHLGLYNYGKNTISPIAQSWFHYPRPVIRVFSHSFQGSLLSFYQGLFLITNVLYLWQFISNVSSRRLLFSHIEGNQTHWVISLYFMLNFCFSLVATVNILRYQYIPMTLMLAFTLVLVDLSSKPEDIVDAQGKKGRAQSQKEKQLFRGY
jgi:hypothetical protein